MAKRETIDGFRGQRRNANKHTQRGIGMLQRAMETSGYVAPMTAAADGEIIDGSARLDVVADVFDGVDPLVIDHDGTRPIIMRRTDIPNADDPRAVRISLEANRIAAADLEWAPDVLAEMKADTPELLAGLWTDAELEAVTAQIADEADMWEGMPEFAPADLDENKITVHFGTATGRAELAALLGQPITEATRFLWFPPESQPPGRAIGVRVAEDES